MDKKLLVLGAGIYQVPAITCARALGIETVVASIPGNYPGFALADKVAYVNTTDAEGLVELARAEGVSGVCTTGTDVSVPALGAVCDALGLRGVSHAAAVLAADKAQMKEAFVRGGVRVAQSVLLPVDATPQEAEAACARIGYPAIIKAIDSSGSRGITRVDAPGDVAHAFEAAVRVTRAATVLVERFLVGEEFGAQAFVQDGVLEFCLPHGDYVFQGDAGVPIGHFAPVADEDVAAQALEQTRRTVAALGLDNCALNMDFILCDGEVYVLEVGARSGATCLAELVGIWYGWDYYEKIVRVALGEKVSFAPANDVRVPNASYLLTSDVTGTIVAQENLNPADDPNVVEVQFDYPVGSHAEAFRIGPHRLGHVICKGATLEEAQANLDRARSRIHLEVEA